MCSKFIICLVLSNALAFHPDLDCPGIYIIPRGEWGSAAPASTDYFTEMPRHIIIHHTNTEKCTTEIGCKNRIRLIQTHDITILGLTDVGANFYIGGDGRVYEGRGWNEKGQHTPNYPDTFGISFIGTYDVDAPTPIMLSAAENLILCGVKQAKLLYAHQIIAHREVSCSNCPGDKLYNEIKTWSKYSQFALPSNGC